MSKSQHTTFAPAGRAASILAAAAVATGCTTSLLRYASVHVDEGAGAADGGVGAQVYGVDDILGVANAVAPPTITRRSPEDAVFEIRSWRVETATATQRVATLSARDAAAPNGGALITIITKERCSGGPVLTDAGALLEALRAAGHPVGYDLTVASIEDDDTDSADAFVRAAATPAAPTSASDLRTAIDGWRALLSSEPCALKPRTGDERAMAAAYDLALAHQLSDASEEAPIFASIAILRAPTQALQLDVVRLLQSAPVGINARTWQLRAAPKDRSVACRPEAGAPAVPQDRRGLARFVAESYLQRPREAAAALERAAQLAAHMIPDGLASGATRTLLRAAETLYARDVCQNIQFSTSIEGERRCHAAIALLDTGKSCP